MLTEDQKAFIKYWEDNREEEGKLTRQLLVGIPRGLLFGVPFLLILFTGKFWYKRADMVANSSLSPAVLVTCLVCIVVFISIFYQRWLWDKKEQQYKEFKALDDQ